MKESPQMQRLEEILRSSKLVSGGFMGTDTRRVFEVIEADANILTKFGYTDQEVAHRMQQITDMAIEGLGTWVKIDKNIQAKVDEAKGSQPCPWPHIGRFAKRETTVMCTDSDKTVMWSDLNIHLIGEHGFFEGKGSNFRNEPEELISIIF